MVHTERLEMAGANRKRLKSGTGISADSVSQDPGRLEREYGYGLDLLPITPITIHQLCLSKRAKLAPTAKRRKWEISSDYEG